VPVASELVQYTLVASTASEVGVLGSHASTSGLLPSIRDRRMTPWLPRALVKIQYSDVPSSTIEPGAHPFAASVAGAPPSRGALVMAAPA
jgi:hypothetical protein